MFVHVFIHHDWHTFNTVSQMAESLSWTSLCSAKGFPVGPRFVCIGKAACGCLRCGSAIPPCQLWWATLRHICSRCCLNATERLLQMSEVWPYVTASHQNQMESCEGLMASRTRTNKSDQESSASQQDRWGTFWCIFGVVNSYAAMIVNRWCSMASSDGRCCLWLNAPCWKHSGNTDKPRWHVRGFL